MSDKHVAKYPPHGMEFSWDCYGASVTEEELLWVMQDTWQRILRSTDGSILSVTFSGQSQQQIHAGITSSQSSTWMSIQDLFLQRTDSHHLKVDRALSL